MKGTTLPRSRRSRHAGITALAAVLLAPDDVAVAAAGPLAAATTTVNP
jgi:hypothetical protein